MITIKNHGVVINFNMFKHYSFGINFIDEKTYQNLKFLYLQEHINIFNYFSNFK